MYRTKEGYLKERFRDMKKRVNGKPAGDGKTQIWLGMEICDRDEFVAQSLNDPEFHRLFDDWEAHNFKRSYAPSVHRIDRSRGYAIDNIEFRKHLDKAKESLSAGHVTRSLNKKLATV